MTASLSVTTLRRLFWLYLVAVGLITVVYGYHNAKAANDWAIGEWLINYSGGFVRRGLTGELILIASRVIHASPVFVALALQLLVFAILFVNIGRLTRDVRWSFPLAAILLSPATLAFHVLDPPAGFRKEILLFAALSILVCALRSPHRPNAIALSLLLLVLTQICVLSHEPLVLYLPYFFGALLMAEPNLRRALQISALPALLALLSVAVASRHPGSLETAQRICSSVGSNLGGSNEGVCGGAILYLTRSLDYARQDTLDSIRIHHYFILYSVTAALTLLPFALLFRALWRRCISWPEQRRSLRILLGTFLATACTSSLLFVIATDWGRWIYIHAVCLLLLVLLIDFPAHLPATSAAPGPASQATPLRITSRSLVYAILVLLYATTWTLPHVGMFPGRFGYPDLIHYLGNYKNVKHTAS